MDFTFGIADRQSSLMTRVLVPGGGGGGDDVERLLNVKWRKHSNMESNNIGI